MGEARYFDHAGTGVLTLRSRLCAYCSRPFAKDVHRRTVDHVVGLKFVPKGLLAGCYNLHVYACFKCNQTKSALETDLSAISMYAGLVGGPEAEILSAEIQRRAKRAISKRTGLSIARSQERLTFAGKRFDTTFSFEFTAPPQADLDRITHLAWFHVQAFVFLMTYDEADKCGRYLSEDFRVATYAQRDNWGDIKLAWFDELTRNWDCQLRSDVAKAFFKIVLRRGPGNIFSWALEWNHSLRLVGFTGPTAEIDAMLRLAPTAEASFTMESAGELYRAIVSAPLDSSRDHLFRWDIGC